VPIAWSSKFGAFVVVFVDADYRPGKGKEKCYKSDLCTVTRRLGYTYVASKLARVVLYFDCSTANKPRDY